MKKYKIDPTQWADETAEKMRAYYEQHRESWWDRHAPFYAWRSWFPGVADGLMINLMNIVISEYNKMEDKKV